MRLTAELRAIRSAASVPRRRLDRYAVPLLQRGGIPTRLPTRGSRRATPDVTRRDVEQFVLAFDSDLAPVVGQQVTLTSDNGGAAGPRIDLLIQRAAAAFTSKALGGTVMECDLVAQVVRNGRIAGYLYDPAAQQLHAGRRLGAAFGDRFAGAGRHSRPGSHLHRRDTGIGVASGVSEGGIC